MKIIISNASDLPIYAQIAEQIKAQILDGSLKSGDPLPSIRNLAKELKISVITTKRAYEELEKERLIETVPGKGSFVASQNLELLREAKMKQVEDYLSLAIREAKALPLSLDELIEMLTILYQEELG